MSEVSIALIFELGLIGCIVYSMILMRRVHDEVLRMRAQLDIDALNRDQQFHVIDPIWPMKEAEE